MIILVHMHPLQEKLVTLAKMRDLSRLSYREIGRQLATDDEPRVHPTNVKYHLDQLIKQGILTESSRPVVRKASEKIAKHTLNLIKIPIVGSANCGPATIFADDKIEGYLEISPQLLKSRNYNDIFALRASGDSMNDTKIMGQAIDDGDFVVVDRSKITPRDGERVVVVRDDVANIKQIFFKPNDGVIVLKSESKTDYQPIIVSPDDNWDGLISGTVIQVVKV